jgi:hypothetical protein
MKTGGKESTSQPSIARTDGVQQVSIIGNPGDTVAPTLPGPVEKPEDTDARNPVSPFDASKDMVRRCVRKICREHGDQLNRSELIRLEQLFHQGLFPKRKAGRRPLARITRAYEDYKGGKRGVELYRAHIPRFEQLSRWRRDGEMRRLMAAIRTRKRREHDQARND